MARESPIRREVKLVIEDEESNNISRFAPSESIFLKKKDKSNFNKTSVNDTFLARIKFIQARA